ncbi:Oidioi.mRNA.OKI2018_I69.chr1.g258.t1.cds [Oikopleura dioica]|uniref:Oidioi.mRNA.OKI2018_I69.chr1.g258.t1.cds n=1 Tax=Oikopleura dioica TaxID=34765 RepID=A0ABN7SQI9_OIKDI|nr:Oidioi.mRNA.OKI2018_I69.chr1.g258.t1.cds [Oikopleura dioica]
MMRDVELIEENNFQLPEISIDGPLPHEYPEIINSLTEQIAEQKETIDALVFALIEAREGDFGAYKTLMGGLLPSEGSGAEPWPEMPDEEDSFTFHFINKYLKWNDAAEYCESFGMSLAYFDSRDDFEKYLQMSREVTPGEIQQRWVDGTSQGRRSRNYKFQGKFAAPWGDYQPTGYYGSEKEECVALYTTFGWEKEVLNDMNCERKQPFACRQNFD